MLYDFMPALTHGFVYCSLSLSQAKKEMACLGSMSPVVDEVMHAHLCSYEETLTAGGTIGH